MPRKASNASTGAGSENGMDQAPPRRSSRIASQPRIEEAPKPAPRPRATKKRSADEGAAEESAEGKAKKAKPTDGGAAGDTNAAKDEAVGEEAPTLAPIDIGDVLPSLVLKNEQEEDIQIADVAKEQGVIMFLVPKADTSGCTAHACAFRDIYPDFTQYGFAVYCLSADSSKSQATWQAKKELPYSLISDPKRILISALGATEGGKTKRSHFIFEKGGKLVDKKIPATSADSANHALEYIKSITAPASST